MTVDRAGPPGGTPLSAEDRRAAFAAGVPHMSRRVIAVGIGVLCVLGVGGALVQHAVTSSLPAPAASSGSPTGHSGAVVPDTPGTGTARSTLHAPLPAFMGLSSLKGAPADGFTLTDAATHAPVSLSGLTGHVVVLSFADARCDDICPVLSEELARADTLLGTTPVPVTFVTVNTDPFATAPHDAVILDRPPFSTMRNVRFLTGSLRQLNAVWASYGISITADRASGVVAHNDLLYFISPAGKIAWTATPFADESASRTYTLPEADVARFATGVARYARTLAQAS